MLQINKNVPEIGAFLLISLVYIEQNIKIMLTLLVRCDTIF